MNYSVIIPTCYEHAKVYSQISAITETVANGVKVFPTCMKVSAAQNRNFAHLSVNTEYIVSVDDDIEGFFPGWAEILIQPLESDPHVRFSSARLMRPGGNQLAHMMHSKFDVSKTLEDVPKCPTSAFAYRKVDFDELIFFQNTTSTPFDQNFEGSGWEDTAICYDLKKRFPETRIVVHNDVKLIHRNEMKNQLGAIFQKNKKYYLESGREI